MLVHLLSFWLIYWLVKNVIFEDFFLSLDPGFDFRMAFEGFFISCPNSGVLFERLLEDSLFLQQIEQLKAALLLASPKPDDMIDRRVSQLVDVASEGIFESLPGPELVLQAFDHVILCLSLSIPFVIWIFLIEFLNVLFLHLVLLVFILFCFYKFLSFFVYAHGLHT